MDLRFEVDDRDIATTYVNGVQGALNQMDTYILVNEMSKIPVNGKYVETGSYLGCSAVIAGLSTKRGVMVYCHDLWVEDMSLLPQDGSPPPVVDGYLYKFYDAIKYNNLESVVIPMRGDSSYTLGIHSDKTIDVAFIDGDHSFDGVKKDLEAILPKMKDGGVILCHDCRQDTPTLRGVESFCVQHQIHEVTGFQGSSILKLTVSSTEL